MGELLSCLLQAYQPLEASTALTVPLECGDWLVSPSQSWIGKQENSKSSDCGLLITHPNKVPSYC